MSHIHIPDGVLPLWIILIGWVITGGLLLVASRRLVGEELTRRLPLLAVMATLMVGAQSVVLPPIGYHLNLTALSGIILGPALGIIAAFIVNLILAMVGHGGITVVGLNTLVFGAEMALGYYLFRGLRGALRGRLGVGLAAGAATLLSLLAGTLLMIAVVAASAVSPGWQMPHGPETLVLPNPFGEPTVIGRPEEADRGVSAQVQVGRFAILVLFLGLIGWPLEAIVTGLVARYLGSVWPDLLEPEGVQARRSR